MTRQSPWITADPNPEYSSLDVMDGLPRTVPAVAAGYEAAIRITGATPAAPVAAAAQSWTPIYVSVSITGLLVIALIVGVLITGPAA